MEVRTALDKFYEVFDNPKRDDVFFDYDGLRYQLSCCCYIFKERTEDGEDEQEYGYWFCTDRCDFDWLQLVQHQNI